MSIYPKNYKLHLLFIYLFNQAEEPSQGPMIM